VFYESVDIRGFKDLRVHCSISLKNSIETLFLNLLLFHWSCSKMG